MAGVVVAMLTRHSMRRERVKAMSLEHALVGVLGAGGYQILGLAFFAAMAGILWRVARRPRPTARRDR